MNCNDELNFKLNFIDEDNNNYLHYLIEKNDEYELNEFLKENDVSKIINNYNNNGKTPLHLAVSKNNQKASKLLIEYGASKDIVDNKGQRIIWIEQNGGLKKKNIIGKRFI